MVTRVNLLIPDDTGSGLLANFNNSPYALLSWLYPDEEWHPWLFPQAPRDFWSKRQNQKKYLLWLGQILGFEEDEDWFVQEIEYRLTTQVLYFAQRPCLQSRE